MSQSHPPEYWRGLLRDMLQRLNAWDLSKRARAVGMELAQLSFGEGAPDVALRQRDLVTVTGLGKACVSKGVRELVEAKVLQVDETGPGPAVYRLLPRGVLAEPEAVVDIAAAERVRAEVRRRNAGRRGGEEASGQARWALGVEEILAEDLARGSAERAVEEGKRQEAAATSPIGSAEEVLKEALASRGLTVAQAVEMSMRGAEVSSVETFGPGRVARDGNPGRAEVAVAATFGPKAGGGAYPYARARAGVESIESITGLKASESIESSDSASGGPRGDSAPVARGRKRFADAWRNHLAERVEGLDPGEFNAVWRGQTVCRFTWLGRIEQEPHAVEQALGEMAEAERSGTKLRNKLGLLYRIARKKAEAAGRVMRMLFC